jgi:adenosine deaminase
VLRPGAEEVTRERLLALPKPELHVHLDGSVRPRTMVELARERGVPLPTLDPDELGRRMVATDTRSLEDYLLRFQLILSVMQDRPALERIAYELAEDNASEGVRWLEARYCPALNTRAGLSLADAVEGTLDGLARAEAELPIRTGVILCALRDHDPAESSAIAEVGVAYRERGVVGFDLAGPERGYPAAAHRDAFRTAAAGGLGITVHAGEADGPESIEQALDDCGAQRIGHGTRLRQDAALLHRVRDRQIPLEVCITSNVQTGAAASAAEHPVRAYYDAEVAVTLNTDNRLVSGTTVTDEYWIAHRELGFGWSEIVEIARTGFRSAFLPDAGKAALLERVERELAQLEARR